MHLYEIYNLMEFGDRVYSWSFSTNDVAGDLQKKGYIQAEFDDDKGNTCIVGISAIDEKRQVWEVEWNYLYWGGEDDDDADVVYKESTAVKLISTIFNIIVVSANKFKPLKIVFEATENINARGDAVNTRAKLYSRIANRYANRMGYAVQTAQPEMYTVVFTLTRRS